VLAKASNKFNRPTEASQSSEVKILERAVSLQLAVGRQTVGGRRRRSPQLELWEAEEPPIIVKLLRSNAELAVRQGPVGKNVNTEAKSLEAVTRQPVKT
jgi:hypothetical protein